MATTLPPSRPDRQQKQSGLQKRPQQTVQPTSLNAQQRAQRRSEQFQRFQQLANTRSFRLLLAWGLILLGLGGLGLKLLQLQVLDNEKLIKAAQEQQTFSLRPFVPRRPMLDRNANVLAIDQKIYTLYAHPVLFKVKTEEMATELAETINIPKAKLLEWFGKHESGIEVATQLSENTAKRIRNLNLDGLELIQQQQRFYPQGDLFGSVIGYVNADREGQAGLELSQQDQLERPAKAVRIRRMGDGSVIPEQLPDGFLHQDELRLQLTLDARLQRATQTALAQQVANYGAKQGTAIVMDAKNGEILALVSAPSYDPNRFYEYDVGLFRNWAVSDLYEPGSTFKPVVMALALEAGAIKPNDVIYDEGQLQISEHIVQNSDFSSAGGRGPLTLNELMQYSSNIAMVHMVERMKPGEFHEWLERLGLGKTLMTDLPGAPASQIKTRKEFETTRIEPATASFGQGLSLTPLQLVQLLGAIANGGKLVTPHVVSGLIDSEGKYHWQPSLPEPRTVFSPATTRVVIEAMESVVDHGTGKPAAIENYRIAGKTGTAQKAENGVYIAGARITSFVSILPANDPRYVVMAVVDEPIGADAYGSTVAAPIVKEIMKAVISVRGIAPVGAGAEETGAEPKAEP